MPEATLLVLAPREVVHRLLLTPLDLPRWNPAFLAIAGPSAAQVGVRWRVRVRPVFSGSFWYERIEADQVTAGWSVLATRESCSWQLIEHPQGTEVRHVFDHRGLLARPLRHAFAPVAHYRVSRLKEVAEHLYQYGTPPWELTVAVQPGG